MYNNIFGMQAHQVQGVMKNEENYKNRKNTKYFIYIL